MLTHPMLDQLNQLSLPGMAQAFAELETAGDAATLSHADWLGLLLDRELTHRRDKRLAARLRYARLRQHAVIALRGEYAGWLDALPETLCDSATGEVLQAIVELDLDELTAAVPPRGYGRD